MKIFTFLSVLLLVFGLNMFAQNDNEDYKNAVSYFKKANDFKARYDFDNAKKYFSDAAILFKKNNYFGNYIQCRYSVADIFIIKNRFKDAENILLEIEDLAIKKYGDNNKYLSNIYFGKAIITSYKGKQDAAIRLYNKALDINNKSERPNEFHKSNIYSGLGNAYSEKGNLDKALDNYKKDIKIKKKILGENHPMLAVGFNNISTIYKSKGEYDLALNYIEKALNLSLNAYGQENIETAKYYSGKGSIYSRKDNMILHWNFIKRLLKLIKQY